MISQEECSKNLESLINKYFSYDDFAESLPQQIKILKDKLSLTKDIIKRYWNLLHVNALEGNSSLNESLFLSLREYEKEFVALANELNETEKMANEMKEHH